MDAKYASAKIMGMSCIAGHYEVIKIMVLFLLSKARFRQGHSMQLCGVDNARFDASTFLMLDNDLMFSISL
jgi:hypothetical protein